MMQESTVVQTARFAALLVELQEIYEVLGDNYRSAAYQKAARFANKLAGVPLDAKAGDLPKGIGRSVWAKWVEFQREGHVEELDQLRGNRKVMAYRELRSLLGVGPKVATAWLSKGINNVGDLRKAVARGDVQLTTVQELGLRHYEDIGPLTRKQAETTYGVLRDVICAAVKCFDICLVGSYRRGKEVVGDMDILVGVENYGAITHDALVHALEGQHITGWISKGETRFSFLIKVGANHTAQVDILLAVREQWPTALLYFTGSKMYNEWMRSAAKKQGMLLNQCGLRDVKTGKMVAVHSEKDVFDALGLPYADPCDRG